MIGIAKCIDKGKDLHLIENNNYIILAEDEHHYFINVNDLTLNPEIYFGANKIFGYYKRRFKLIEGNMKTQKLLFKGN